MTALARSTAPTAPTAPAAPAGPLSFTAFVKLAAQGKDRTHRAIAAGAFDYDSVLQERGGRVYALPVALPWLLLTVELIELLSLGEMNVPTVRATMESFRGRMTPAWTTGLQSDLAPAVYLTKPGDPAFGVKLSFLSHAVALWRTAQTAQTA